MSDVLKAEIVVKAKSKKGTGICDGNDVWYNASKGVSFDAIQRNDKLQLSYVTGGENGKFVLSFTKMPTNAAPALPVNPPAVHLEYGNAIPVTVAASPAAKMEVSVAPLDEKMSKADWNAKDLKITKGGVAHDAATIVTAMVAMKTLDEVKTLYTELFNHILATVTK